MLSPVEKFGKAQHLKNAVVRRLVIERRQQQNERRQRGLLFVKLIINNFYACVSFPLLKDTKLVCTMKNSKSSKLYVKTLIPVDRLPKTQGEYSLRT